MRRDTSCKRTSSSCTHMTLWWSKKTQICPSAGCMKDSEILDTEFFVYFFSLSCLTGCVERWGCLCYRLPVRDTMNGNSVDWVKSRFRFYNQYYDFITPAILWCCLIVSPVYICHPEWSHCPLPDTTRDPPMCLSVVWSQQCCSTSQ